MNKVLKKRSNHFMDGSKRMNKKSYNRVIQATAEFRTQLARKPSTKIRLVHLSFVQNVEVGASLAVAGMNTDPLEII